jgi:hypothetical protein
LFFLSTDRETLVSWKTRWDQNVSVSMLQCSKGFNSLVCTGSGRALRLKDNNLNIHYK